MDSPSGWAFVIGLVLGIFMTLVLMWGAISVNKMIAEYYQVQTKMMCSLANSYRDFAIQAKPDMESLLPQALDCKKLTQIFMGVPGVVAK